MKNPGTGYVGNGHVCTGHVGSWMAFALAIMLVLPASFAQDGDDEESERDLRPARERFALELGRGLEEDQQPTGRWSLEFVYDTPESVVVTNEDGSRDVIWYMTFTVRNENGRKVPLRLGFTLTTDVERGPLGERERLTYVDIASPGAEALVEKRLGPLENSATQMRGAKKEEGEKTVYSLSYIDDGELRRGIAIFGAVDPNADEFTIDVKGLVDPIKHERKEVVAEVKLLRIKYSRPGDAYERQLDTLEREGEEWIVAERQSIRNRAR